MPDGGDAFLHGHSVSRHMGQASRHVGYCPQAGALPGLLTGREVLRMYARLRGFPLGFQAAAVDDLLSRMDLQQYADRSVSCVGDLTRGDWLWANVDWPADCPGLSHAMPGESFAASLPLMW